MNILLVYPNYPDTFWSFRHALKFIGKKSTFPPLGLLTVAALLPREWGVRLVDLNIRTLTDDDLAWADLLFISAMSIQKESVRDVLTRAKQAGVRTVAGGPLFTTGFEDFPEADHLVLNEAELTLPPFLRDLEAGTPQRIYRDDRFADIRQTPAPRWDLIEMRHYSAMNIQYSRGCPFDCEFCDITGLFGRRPRTKSVVQITVELDGLYALGWRGGLFFVDDNFIGDKRRLTGEVLPAIIAWQEQHRHPFGFFTEASIDLADDPELMALMVRAGFEEVFIGIETPHEESLQESRKHHNRNRNLTDAVRKIQNSGLQVQGGFIVGFDSDPVTIFERQIRFIQESGIVTAMVGLLTALRGTRLHQRLASEGRLLATASGNNTDVALNFIPRMSPEDLIQGYGRILDTIYAPSHYYARLKTFLNEFQPLKKKTINLRWNWSSLRALAASMLVLGVIGRERVHYWRLFFWSLFRRPRLFPLTITLAIYGFHFRKVAEQVTRRILEDGEPLPGA